MHALLITLAMCLFLLSVTSRRQHHVTDLCQPCAGSSTSLFRSLLLVDRIPRASSCYYLREALIQVQDISMTVLSDTQHMVDSVFDGDISHLDEDPLNYLFPYDVSPMAMTFNKLVHLHFYLKLIENNPLRSTCGVTSNFIADRLPVCPLRNAIGTDQLRSSGLYEVCRQKGFISLTSCPRVHRYAYRVLVMSRLILSEVRREIRRFLTNRGCFLDK